MRPASSPGCKLCRSRAGRKPDATRTPLWGCSGLLWEGCTQRPHENPAMWPGVGRTPVMAALGRPRQEGLCEFHTSLASPQLLPSPGLPGAGLPPAWPPTGPGFGEGRQPCAGLQPSPAFLVHVEAVSPYCGKSPAGLGLEILPPQPPPARAWECSAAHWAGPAEKGADAGRWLHSGHVQG